MDRPTASATPKALVTLTGIVGLDQRHPEPCTIGDDGNAIWRLAGGLEVTLNVDTQHWHLRTATPQL